MQKGLYRNAYCKDMSKIIFVSNHSDLSAQELDVFRAKALDRDQDG
jgi:hypothetical protein